MFPARLQFRLYDSTQPKLDVICSIRVSAAAMEGATRKVHRLMPGEYPSAAQWGNQFNAKGRASDPAYSSLVLHGGFEPSTLGLEVPCSIQLS